MLLQDPWNPKPTHPITPITACKKPAANMALKEFFVSIFSPFFWWLKPIQAGNFNTPFWNDKRRYVGFKTQLGGDMEWTHFFTQFQTFTCDACPFNFCLLKWSNVFSQYKSHGILTHIFGESHRNVADLQEKTETTCSFLTNKQQVNDTTLNTQNPL